MRKGHAVIAIFIITAISLFAVGSVLLFVGPSLQVEWRQTYPGGFSSSLRSAKMTSDGGFIMAGFSAGSVYNFSGGSVRLHDFWLQKVDSHGNPQWSKTYPSTNDSLAFSTDQTTDGGYIISGMTAVPPLDSNMRFLLVKVDQYGNEEWNKTYPGGSYPWGYSVQQTTDEGYILTGGEGIYVIKTYYNGSLQWNRSYPLSPGLVSSHVVSQTSDGGYILLGSADAVIKGFGDYPGILLLKIDAVGNPQWNRTIASIEYADSYSNSIQETSDGGYMLAGTTHRVTINNYGFPTLENSQAFLLKLYSNGTTQWNETYSTADWSNGMEAWQTSDGGYISSISAPWGLGAYAWLWRTDTNGTTVWYKPVESGIYVFYLQQTADGDYVLAGYGSSFSAVLMKVSSAPPLFSPEVIPIVYIASGGFLAAGITVGIAIHLRSRREHTKQRNADLPPSR